MRGLLKATRRIRNNSGEFFRPFAIRSVRARKFLRGADVRDAAGFVDSGDREGEQIFGGKINWWEWL